MRFSGQHLDRACIVCDFGAAVGGAAQAAGSVAAAGIQASAAQQAAQLQAAQENKAAAALQTAGTKAQTYLQPYVTGGQQSYSNLLNSAGQFTQVPTADQSSAIVSTQDGLNQLQKSAQTLDGLSNGPNAEQTAAASTLNTLQNGPTQAQLAQTPGYQFELQQGEEATNNSAAARGLSSSGAALKGADAYANNLADTNYQNNYQDLLGTEGAQQTLGQNEFTNSLNTAQGYQNTSNDYLAGAQAKLNINASQQGNVEQAFSNDNLLAQYGQTAAGSSGTEAINAAGGSAPYIANVGGAQASGVAGSANALSTGLANVGNTASQYATYQNLLNGGTTTANSNDPFGSSGVDASVFGA